MQRIDSLNNECYSIIMHFNNQYCVLQFADTIVLSQSVVGIAMLKKIQHNQ